MGLYVRFRGCDLTTGPALLTCGLLERVHVVYASRRSTYLAVHDVASLLFAGREQHISMGPITRAHLDTCTAKAAGSLSSPRGL